MSSGRSVEHRSAFPRGIVATVPNFIAVLGILCLLLGRSEGDWGGVLVVLVYGVPLFLVSLVMTVTAAVSRRKTRPDFMWLAWSLFAVQMLFWLTIIVLNMRSSRGA